MFYDWMSSPVYVFQVQAKIKKREDAAL